MENIANFIEQCLNAVLNIFNFLNPLSEDFILKDVITFLGNILSYINPLSDNFILKDIISFFIELLSYINPLSDNFFAYKIIDLLSDLLEYLFIPKEDHFTEIKEIIENKFGFINQVKELVNALFVFPSTVEDKEVPPSFDITYMGVTLTIIDFSVLETFRGTFHAIVIFILWATYLIRLFTKIPGLIGGFHVEDAEKLTF